MAAVAGAKVGSCDIGIMGDVSSRIPWMKQVFANPQFPEGTGHEPPGNGAPKDGDRRGGEMSRRGFCASGTGEMGTETPQPAARCFRVFTAAQP